MPIVFICEWCGRPISAAPELAGGTMSCPGCAAALSVPVPVMASVVVPDPLQRVAPQFYYPAPPQSKGTGLAALSLVLGFVGLVPCLCMIPNLFAVVFGMSALRTGTTSPAAARAGVVLGIIGILFTATFWGLLALRQPPPNVGRPESPQDICQNSLRSLAKEVERYKREHDGAFPPDMAALKSEERAFWSMGCPENKSRDTEPDFLYAPPAEPILGTIIACDAAGRHQGGRNVLHASGYVTFVSADGFAREMEEPRNRALAQVWAEAAKPKLPAEKAAPEPSRAAPTETP